MVKEIEMVHERRIKQVVEILKNEGRLQRNQLVKRLVKEGSMAPKQLMMQLRKP